MHFNQYFNRISVRNKLLLFLAIPIITLLLFFFDSFQQEQKKLGDEHHLSKHIDISFSISNVITELQKERGLTAGLSKKNQSMVKNSPELTAQWIKTNQAIQLFKEHLTLHSQYSDIDSKNKKHIEQFINLLNIRMDIHQSVFINDNHEIYFDMYSKIISQGILIVQFIERITLDIDLSRMTSAYVSLVQLQEQSAQERGLLNGVIEAQKINSREFSKLSTLVSNQKIYLINFESEAGNDYSKLLLTKLEHPNIEEVNSIRQDVLNKVSRQELLNELQEIIGYGGLIHLFKNYVIRGDKKYADKFRQLLKKMERIVRTFPFQENTTEQEKELFKQIVLTFEKYSYLLTTVSKQKALGNKITEIDKIVRVNDDLAIDAIKQLRSKLSYYDVSNWWNISTFKVEQFYDTRKILEKEIRKHIANVMNNASKQIKYYLLSAIATIFSTFVFGYFLFRRLVNDITNIAHTMEGMHTDNKNNQLLPVDGDDEITKMSHAFNQMIIERIEYEKQLQQALEKAQEGIVAKSQFLSTMSHEIRTPLNGVLGMTELLSQTPLNKEQHEYIDTVMNSGKLLLTIINDILDFSKLEADGITLEQISFNLEKTCFDTLQLLSTMAAEKNIELILSYPLDIPQNFISDPSRIRQTLLNLINNAIKFTSSGHVYLEITGYALEEDLYRLTFSVQDTGIGIDEKYQSRLFDSFTQAEQSTTRKFGGTGLGLSISQRLIELMGGVIEVNSELDKGSTFYFTLTLPISETAPKSMNADLSGTRALVVIDNPVNLGIIEKTLQHYNIETVLLDNPEQTIVALKESKNSGNPFHVALLEHHIPGINAFELAKSIRKEPDYNAVQLLLLTSGGRKGDAERARNAGFAAYHTKPIRSEILIQSLINVLSDKQSKQVKTELLTNFNIEDAIDNKQLKDHSSFTGKVLLTEDNIVNQKVALAVLKKLGLEVDLANDGLEAVEKFKNNHYDLIFMDCLMPNMDGFEATQAIRKNETSVEHTPIIALTANALAEDEKKCRDSGMDDFVSKPFKKVDITNALGRWLKR